MASSSVAGGKVDRQTTVPFHLKLFYRSGGFPRLEEFQSPSPSTLPPHLQIYTWPTCNLRELSHLLTTALPALLPEPAVGTRLSYRLIIPDTREMGRPGPGRYLSQELGSVVIGASGLTGSDEQESSGAKLKELEGEPEKTLQEARFVIGDYIACAIFPPLANGAVVGSNAGRENGAGGFRVRGSARGGASGAAGAGFPHGEWRRGELPSTRGR